MVIVEETHQTRFANFYIAFLVDVFLGFVDDKWDNVMKMVYAVDGYQTEWDFADTLDSEGKGGRKDARGTNDLQSILFRCSIPP